MGRVFGRGELKQAILVVLESLGTAHGYAIMGELEDRVGGGWHPSPGAIYPALLALVERGYVESVDDDGTRLYSLTPEGHREARSSAIGSRWASVRAKATKSERRITVGTMLDNFASGSAVRRRLPDEAQKADIESILRRTASEIEHTLSQGEDDG